MQWENHIVSENNILAGKPIIKGTRISVEMILQHLNNGWNRQTIKEAYPHLTEEQLNAVFSFIYDCISNESLISLKRSA